jgi:hypothetical protein
MPLESNVGEYGVKSIRLAGQRIENLPIAENAGAAPQLSVAQDIEKQSQVENILARYPNQKTPYLKSRITEAHENIKRMEKLIHDEQALVEEYRVTIGLCARRDEDIKKITAQQELSLEEHTQQVKALYLKVPPYNIKAMETQIKQSEQSIKRAEKVIKTEYGTVAEFTRYLTLCEARDLELKALGVKLEGG